MSLAPRCHVSPVAASPTVSASAETVNELSPKGVPFTQRTEESVEAAITREDPSAKSTIHPLEGGDVVADQYGAGIASSALAIAGGVGRP